ncbi:MAG: cellulase family glycosylhydrolase, partial [Gammaproteobacteria bacterium]
MAGVTVADGALRVAGTHTIFIPRGFNSVGVLYPEPYAHAMCTRMDPVTQRNLAAAEAAMTGQTEQQLLAMREKWRANTVRFQVSQGALAYEHARHLVAYTARVLSVIRRARAAGLIVIVSMQAESLGCTPLLSSGQKQKLPDRQTEAAWAQLAPSLRQVPGAMLEIFNEPNTQVACGNSSSTSWTEWAYGCGGDDVGMVALAGFVRKLAPGDVLLLDGDRNAETFAGFHSPPGIPANSAYAIHPYGYTDGPTDWNRRFGDFQNQGHAVVATEWSETTGRFVKLHPYFDRFHPAAAHRRLRRAKELLQR